MYPYFIVLEKTHEHDGEIFTGNEDDSIYKDIKSIFEAYELYLSIDEYMKHADNGDYNVFDIVNKCYEQYWSEPYTVRCPIIAKYHEHEWIDFDVSKIVKKYVDKYIEKNFDEDGKPLKTKK